MMDTINALILAAGRGSRLQNMTDNCPKGLVPLTGRPLVEWQIAALRAAGFEHISVATGYLSEKFDYLGLPTVHNPDWDRTNMVGSLMCRLDADQGPVLIGYSDIVYRPDVAATLARCPADIAITYDVEWLDLWSDRFDDPMSDAESFRINSEGHLLEIGRSAASAEEVQGQFMGLVKLSKAGVGIVRDIVASCSKHRAELDMTGLLDLCLANGQTVQGVPVRGQWCEIDNQNDLRVAERRMREGRLDLVQPREVNS